MRRRELAAIGGAIACIAAASYASETITYTYDSRGRLVKVERSGTVNDKVAVNYSYDKADNRTLVNTASPTPPPK